MVSVHPWLGVGDATKLYRDPLKPPWALWSWRGDGPRDGGPVKDSAPRHRGGGRPFEKIQLVDGAVKLA